MRSISPSSSPSWYKTIRNPELHLELWKRHRPAYFLLHLIAQRACWHDGFNALGLKVGQAMLGNSHQQLDMSAREYRTAKTVLKSTNGVTIETTKDNRTIATIINGVFFHFTPPANDKRNDKRDGKEATNGRQTSDKRATTYLESKEGVDGKEGKPSVGILEVEGKPGLSIPI